MNGETKITANGQTIGQAISKLLEEHAGEPMAFVLLCGPYNRGALWPMITNMSMDGVLSVCAKQAATIVAEQRADAERH